MTREQNKDMQNFINGELQAMYPIEYLNGMHMTYTRKLIEIKYKRNMLDEKLSYCYLGSYGKKVNKHPYDKTYFVNHISGQKFSITLV